MPNLLLGPLLGRGGDGKVFRGMYCGDLVAVKVSRVVSVLGCSWCAHSSCRTAPTAAAAAELPYAG